MQYKIKILVLMASTPGRPEARINAEARTIKDIVEAPGTRDRFSIHLEPAARPADLLHALRDHQPDVVHFCGHGDDGQIFLHDHDGDAQPVSPHSLAELFRTSGHRARLVVFNVCRSLRHAQAVLDHVDCAIGMATAISDRAAIEFAASLYRALVAGKPVGSAYEQAFAVLGAAGLAMPGAPDMRCLAAAGQRAASGLVLDRPAGTDSPVLAPARGHHEIKARGWRRWVRPLAAAAAVATVLVAGLALFWPMIIPEFPEGAGIVVVKPRSHASAQEYEAYTHFIGEFQRRWPQHVVAVERSLAGTSNDGLIRAARDAGASLVVMFDGGPTIRILPVPGTRGTEFIKHIPRLSVASEDTRTLLAPILYALAWSAVNEPTALPADLYIPIPSADKVTPEVAALAMVLRHLKDPADITWHVEARPVLDRMAQRCGRSRDDWSCAMTRYLRYGLVCPDCPGAREWLHDVATRRLDVIGDAAMIDLMERKCGDDPDWVEKALLHENVRWSPHECGRLALAGPASCLIIEHGRNQNWLDVLANPNFDDFHDQCGDMPARTLARKAMHHGNVGNWHEAAELYEEAMARSPASKAYALDWFAAVLQIQPRPDDLINLVDQYVNIDYIEDRRRIHAEFLWWLLTSDHSRASERICGSYRDQVADGQRAIPRLGNLGKRLCAHDEKGMACQVYEILIAGKSRTSADKLCRMLARAATASDEQSRRGHASRCSPDRVDDMQLLCALD